MGIAISYGTRQTMKLFLLFEQHRQQHDLKGRIASQIGARRRMVSGCGK